MASLRVTHTIGDLESDLRTITVQTPHRLGEVVRDHAYTGNSLARDNARHTAGKHGKLYPKAFSVEARTPLSWEYGPDAASPQGGMSFEFGSRNQPPHLDLAKSADVVGPKLAKAVGDVVDGLFWPR